MASSALAYDNDRSGDWHSTAAVNRQPNRQPYHGSQPPLRLRMRQGTAQATERQALPDRHPQPQQKPDLRAIPGRRTDPALHPVLGSFAKTLVAMSAVVLTVVTLVCVGRILLVNLTATAAADAVELDTAISEARAEGLKLEMQHALAASSTTIQKQAMQLGMISATVETLPASSNLNLEAQAAINAMVAQQQAERDAAAQALAAQQRAAEAAFAAAQRAAENATANSAQGTSQYVDQNSTDTPDAGSSLLGDGNV